MNNPVNRGKSVSFEVTAWWNPNDKCINMASPNADSLILSVRNDPSQNRGYPQLFRELTKILKDAGAPAPDEQELKLAQAQGQNTTAPHAAHDAANDILVSSRDTAGFTKLKQEAQTELTAAAAKGSPQYQQASGRAT
jgi:hypothetical protein